MIEPSKIRTFSLFDGLKDEQFAFLLPMLKEEVFEGATDIAVEGTRSDKLRLIVEGRVIVQKAGVVLMELDEGDVFRETEILDAGPSYITVKALAATRVITLSIDALGEIFEKDMEIYAFLFMNLARDITRRQRRVDAKLASSSPPTEWS
jgi:CRP-like cAMP-binding protein